MGQEETAILNVINSSSAAPSAEASDRNVLLTEEGFGELVERYQPRIFRVLVGWTGDEGAADNLTQETFLRAYRARGSFRGESAVSTWLHRIAVRVAQDHEKNRKAGFWRRLVRWGGDETPEEPPEDLWGRQAGCPERDLLAREEVDRLRRLVAELPAGQRAVFQLRFVEEMSVAEVAEVLGLKPGTVKAQLHRAVHAVRGRWGAAADASAEGEGRD